MLNHDWRNCVIMYKFQLMHDIKNLSPAIYYNYSAVYEAYNKLATKNDMELYRIHQH